MPISSEQCRAARGLLSWTQDKLAENARISRATVVEFENDSWAPTRSNLRSMEDCMYSAGVEFISEFEELGFGVRLRERKLKYLKNIKVDRFNSVAVIKMEYAGEPFLCKIDLDTIDDLNRTNYQTDKEFVNAISELIHHILAAVENEAKNGIENGNVLLTYEMLEPTIR